MTEVSGPEFSRIVRLDEIGRINWPVHEKANADELVALTARFGFASLDMLEADYSLERDGATIMATGKVKARLSQPCIATGEPVEESLDEDFTIRFTPAGVEEAVDDPLAEIELDADECDTLTYEGERIDMGEAVAETLALAVDPYPRSPNAEEWLRKAGVLTEDQAGPFGALAALKARMDS